MLDWSVEWIYLAQDRVQWLVLMTTVMNPLVPKTERNLLVSWEAIDFSRRALFLAWSALLFGNAMGTREGNLVSGTMRDDTVVYRESNGHSISSQHFSLVNVLQFFNVSWKPTRFLLSISSHRCIFQPKAMRF